MFVLIHSNILNLLYLIDKLCITREVLDNILHQMGFIGHDPNGFSLDIWSILAGNISNYIKSLNLVKFLM
jgi:hypothetical protein